MRSLHTAMKTQLSQKKKKNLLQSLESSQSERGKDMFTCKDKDNSRFPDGNNAKENTETSLKY